MAGLLAAPNEIRDSATSPLRIDEVRLASVSGILGLTLCPGKWDQNGDVVWRRDLLLDLKVVKRWGASVVISLLEDFEFSMLRVGNLPQLVNELGMTWIHLPIRDGGIPEVSFETIWTTLTEDLHARLEIGERIMIHCRGGMGRTGIVAARILVEDGFLPAQAMAEIRAIRSGAIEHGLQEDYVLGLRLGQRPISRTE